MKIPGGYYIISRQIAESRIAHCPPHFREIWNWLIMEANHASRKSSGRLIKRGQLLRTFRDIQNGLSWKVGYRKETYKKHHCEKAMKWLVKENMVETTKVTRGLLITICNYDIYQDPKNYESDTEGNNESDKRATRERQEKQEGEEEEELKEEIVEQALPQIPYKEIIDFLNEKTGSKFRLKTNLTRRLIKVRWNEGFREEDFRHVIEKKVAEWKGDAHMVQFLRPLTLFGTKFESYLQGKNISKCESCIYAINKDCKKDKTKTCGAYQNGK